MEAAGPGEAALVSRQLETLAGRLHPAIRAGCRAIMPGDEHRLTAAEAAPLARAVAPVRRASAAARLLAKELLAEAGCAGPIELPRPLRMEGPRWPPDYAGSLAHDAEVAVAAVVRIAQVASLGVDVEPALPLPADLLDVVATPRERTQLGGDLLAARLLFCMKEAVYKTTNPLDGIFLDHHDVEVDLPSRIARTASGRLLRIEAAAAPRLVAITMLAA
jgi:4'-phosphopantetheinyl transferase EntD